MLEGAKLPSPKSEPLKPVLVFNAITLGPTAFTAFSDKSWVLGWQMALASIGVGVFVWAYVWLLIKHPDRLQSEDYMSKLLGDDRKGTLAVTGPPVPPEPLPPIAPEPQGT